MMPAVRSCYVIDRTCPRCGSTLISNSRIVWCSFVGFAGDPDEVPCDYGIDREIPDPLSKEARESRWAMN